MKPAKPRRSARQRRRQLVPQHKSYSLLATVLWPIVTTTSAPSFTSPHVSTDTRGHRVTRRGAEETRSDAAPDNAAFLLGGSYAFGVGASSDEGTLAAALWRRTSVPYVNLGVRAWTSTQELVAALPYVNRSTTFVVCSGVNNLSRVAVLGPGLDPLLGPIDADQYLEQMLSVPLRLVTEAATNPARNLTTGALAAELAQRLLRRPAPRVQTLRRKKRPEAEEDLVALAADRQLRDLRALRRLVPDDADVVFALQPFAPAVEKEWSPEETELFTILDLIQGKKWERLLASLFAHWPAYSAALERGCDEIGVPFVDLSGVAYDGWCFVDRAHQTDRGHDQAAAALAGLLGGEQAVAQPVAARPAPAPAAELDELEEADEARDDDLLDTEEDPNVYPLW